jgi:hypothetical protein
MAIAFRKRKTVQGVFSPLNPQKCVGVSKPVYRSSYEKHFMRWADKNPNVVQWGSETVVIPYLNPIDKRLHRYIVDNFIVLRSRTGELLRYLVEIKPAKSTRPPITKNRKNKKTLLYEQVAYAENQSKWQAADAWCKRNKAKFIVLDEYTLGIKTSNKR